MNVWPEKVRLVARWPSKLNPTTEPPPISPTRTWLAVGSYTSTSLRATPHAHRHVE